MLWLVAAIVALLVSVASQLRKSAGWQKGSIVAFYLLLIAWIVAEAGGQAFQGSETSFLGFFVGGLAILAVGELLPVWDLARVSLSQAAAPLAAFAFALGFDMLHPDEYSYVPATFLGLLVLVVAWRAYVRLATGPRKKKATINVSLLLYIVAVALLVYSAVFKMIDRGWLLPWAYLASAGALLFSTAQVWLGWEKVLKQKPVSGWIREGVFNLGILIMVVAAFFVYREFL